MPAITKTQKKRGKDPPKVTKKAPNLSGPISEITKDSHTPVIDIATYVHRSTEERIQEVASSKMPDKIKRPMNAFMLYRKAYQNRVKEWCSQHKVVSQVCGDSWILEPDYVRAQFTHWAKIERDNHYKAHPSYKFTPSKAYTPKTDAAKRRRGDDGDDPDDNLVEDTDWRGSKLMRRTATPVDNGPAFHACNKPMPFAHGGHAASKRHYHPTMQGHDGPVEHASGLQPQKKYHHQHYQQAAFSLQRVDPSLSGTAGELLDQSNYGQYPHDRRREDSS
jgi:hypothetical protein